jgi:hypothetical protein
MGRIEIGIEIEIEIDSGVSIPHERQLQNKTFKCRNGYGIFGGCCARVKGEPSNLLDHSGYKRYKNSKLIEMHSTLNRMLTKE